MSSRPDDRTASPRQSDLGAVISRVSNWGRWGAYDERGTANLVTPAKRVAAAQLVRKGAVFSLAIPLDSSGPLGQESGDPRFNPQHAMLQTGTDALAGVQPYNAEGWGVADDVITMPLQCGTQWDSLAHIFHDNRMYNGGSAELVGARGATRNGIQNHAADLVSRGVLLDVPRALGLQWLPLDHEITRHELELTLDRQNVDPEPGDVLLIRTGNMFRARRNGGWEDYTWTAEPGPGLDALVWFHERDVAAVATDTWSFEVLPSRLPVSFPVHVAAIVHMGLLLGEIFSLDELADDCAGDGVYEFLFVGPPLPFTGAVGSPINPIALK